jgi:polyphosphate kinase
MNALIDLKIIDALYAASQAGVEIDLIIRGMCTLRPGIRGLSDRIRVRSIVGRFLEHTRIFWFQNGDSPEIFAGSADWMQRNLYERCEVVFPVTDEPSANRLRYEILEAYLRDDVKARLMQPDGSYIRAPRKGSGFAAQDWLMDRAHHPDSAFDSLASKSAPQPAVA